MIEKKKCSRCKKIKNIDDFYKAKRYKNGINSRCKYCKREIGRIYQQSSANKKLRAKSLKWNKEHKEKVYESIKKYNLKYPEKYKARGVLRSAIFTGRIIRKPCEICGEVKSHGHHFDYFKPLEVLWLCAIHHKSIHSKYT